MDSSTKKVSLSVIALAAFVACGWLFFRGEAGPVGQGTSPHVGIDTPPGPVLGPVGKPRPDPPQQTLVKKPERDATGGTITRKASRRSERRTKERQVSPEA